MFTKYTALFACICPTPFKCFFFNFFVIRNENLVIQKREIFFKKKVRLNFELFLMTTLNIVKSMNMGENSVS